MKKAMIITYFVKSQKLRNLVFLPKNHESSLKFFNFLKTKIKKMGKIAAFFPKHRKKTFSPSSYRHRYDIKIFKIRL